MLTSPTSQARGRFITLYSLGPRASSRGYCRSRQPREPGHASPGGRSAQAARLLPTAGPPRRRSGRTAIRKGQRPELCQRTDVNEPLEVDDLLDRPPVVDPAASIEFRLVAQIEAQAVGFAVQMQQEPALLLPHAHRGLLAADVALGQAVAEPALRPADQLDVAGLEADLLVQLPVHRRFRALVRPDAA